MQWHYDLGVKMQKNQLHGIILTYVNSSFGRNTFEFPMKVHIPEKRET